MGRCQISLMSHEKVKSGITEQWEIELQIGTTEALLLFLSVCTTSPFSSFFSFFLLALLFSQLFLQLAAACQDSSTRIYLTRSLISAFPIPFPGKACYCINLKQTSMFGQVGGIVNCLRGHESDYLDVLLCSCYERFNSEIRKCPSQHICYIEELRTSNLDHHLPTKLELNAFFTFSDGN